MSPLNRNAFYCNRTHVYSGLRSIEINETYYHVNLHTAAALVSLGFLSHFLAYLQYAAQGPWVHVPLQEGLDGGEDGLKGPLVPDLKQRQRNIAQMAARPRAQGRQGNDAFPTRGTGKRGRDTCSLQHLLSGLFLQTSGSARGHPTLPWLRKGDELHSPQFQSN